MKQLVILLLLLTPLNSQANQEALTLFPLTDVTLLDSPFLHAQQTNLNYILSMDPDRLLAPYLKEAGLPSKANNYGNWEDTGLGGHIGGHYLTALAQIIAATGNKEAQRRLTYMINTLKRCQDAHGNGYIGGVPNGNELWKNIAKGNIQADLFSLNQSWVPWYNLHKTYSGLRDAYQIAGNQQAKDMLIKLSDWTIQLLSKLNEQQIQTMLTTEYGGMNEIFADVADITGDKKYLKLAKQFSHQKILKPLQQHQDQLNGLHANTQIPKIIGFKRIADIEENKSWEDAAAFFWDKVVNTRTTSIGGNSVKEHFHPSDDFSSMINEVEGPETCNTYNMLKLSKMLFQSSADLKYINYYERGLYNHILSSQHPEHGGLVYFTPMRPNHYRVYSQAETSMWCCVGSGIENHGKYGELIYAHGENSVYINLFIPSKLDWKENAIALTQNTRFPDQEISEITIHSSKIFTLKLRHPHWINNNTLTISINGKIETISSKPGSYLSILRNWQAGDTLLVYLPMKTRLEEIHPNENYFSILHGPIVLAAKTKPFANEQLNFLSDEGRMSHIPTAQMCPLESSPIFVGDKKNYLSRIEKIATQALAFKVHNLTNNKTSEPLELIPFFRLHDSRYVLYWPYSSQKDYKNRHELLAKAEQQRLQLKAITIDQITPGEQQPESDHFFKGKDTEAGVHRNRHWRHSSAWFSYELKDPNKEASTLRITYYGLDQGRSFAIFLNKTKIADVTLESSQGDNFYTDDYAIPKKVLSDNINRPLTLKFVAEKNSIAGGIYGIRLLR